MARPLRIVCYGVNGAGVGHVTRLAAIARWLRRLTAALGAPAEIWFLTSSEATRLLFDERFAAFKLPSKTVVGAAGIDKLAYLALAKQWVWHSLGLLRPDLLVVDTFPRGSFGELLSALDLAERRAFVYRPTRPEFAARPDFQAMLPLYDAIVVPEHARDAPVVVPEGVADRVHHVGPITIRDREEILPRAEARARLGLPPDGGPVVFVSAGGGGDPEAETRIAAACEALAPWEEATVVVGAGPLFRGRPRRGPRIVWLESERTAELARAFDVALCAAGYNTFWEMMLAGVPTLFWPQDKIADDQAARARRAADAGAGEVLEAGIGGAQLLARVRALVAPERHAAASGAAASLLDRSHARDAAEVLLRQVLPRADVDLAVSRASTRAVSLERRWGADLGLIAEVDQALAGREGGGDRGRPAPDLAVDVIERAAELGFSSAVIGKVVVPLARKLPVARPRERASAVGDLLTALAAFGDPAAAVPFVRVMVTERALSADALVVAMRSFLDEHRGGGGDLHEAALLLSRAAVTAGDTSSNGDLVERARRASP